MKLILRDKLLLTGIKVPVTAGTIALLAEKNPYLNCAFDSLSILLMACTSLFLLGFGFNITTCTCQVCGITLWRCTQMEHSKTENPSIFLRLTNDEDFTETFQFQFSILSFLFAWIIYYF